MSPLLRRGVPRRPRKVRIRTGIIAASGVVAVVGALIVSQIDTMRWFGIGQAETAGADSGLRMLEVEGESPAERVATELIGWAKPEGWKAAKTQAEVGDPFGLTCLDGAVAWATARTRLLSDGGAEGQVFVAAYPAGGGGLAFQQASTAASSCATDSKETEFGVESFSYAKGGASVQVIRRGDVLAVVASTPGDRLPGEGWLTALDDRLVALLGDSCRTVDAAADESRRNPFIDPEAFAGNVVLDPVPFPDVDLTRADDVATDPVVALDAVPPTVPDAGERPAPLDPAPIDLPELPAEVQRPEAPVPPKEPDLDGRAQRAVADPDGPGCGWDFTGQAAPKFDEAVASRQAEKAVKAERTRLVDDAVAFEQGKVNFYRAWAEHLTAVQTYSTYVTELGAAREKWQVVIDARSAFVAEFEKYRASLAAVEKFTTDRAAAQKAFEENQLACLDPFISFTDPSVTCPAPRPAILEQSAPTPLPRPVATPEAQLPADWEPPAPAAPAEED